MESWYEDTRCGSYDPWYIDEDKQALILRIYRAMQEEQANLYKEISDIFRKMEAVISKCDQ